VGDGASTEIAVEHKLGTKHVVTNVYESTAPFAEVIPTVEITDENHVTLIFLTAPSLDQYVVVVVSGGGGGGGGPLVWEDVEALNGNLEPVGGERPAKVQFAVSPEGQVYFAGTCHLTGTIEKGATVWEVPAPARPVKIRIVLAPSFDAVANTSSLQYLEVTPGGVVRNGVSALPSGNYVAFDNSEYSRIAT
jgi:hypothetical protein